MDRRAEIDDGRARRHLGDRELVELAREAAFEIVDDAVRLAGPMFDAIIWRSWLPIVIWHRPSALSILASI